MKLGLKFYYQELLTNINKLDIDFSFRSIMNLIADGKWEILQTLHHRAPLLNIEGTRDENPNDRHIYGHIYR